jgi:uncharacterized membrane protein (TIGR02234 family)
MSSPSTEPVAPASGRRELSLAMLLCVVGGAAALWAAGRVWVHYTANVAPLPAHAATATGHRADAFASTGALVVLAGVVVLPATRAWGRRVAGVLLALAGAGLGYGAIQVLRSPVTHVGSLNSKPLGAHATAWPWLTVAGGVLAVVAGVLATVRSARWPAMGRRYETAGAARQRPATEVSMWDRLDEGDDPTA